MKLPSVEENIIATAYDETVITLGQYQKQVYSSAELANMESPNSIVARALKRALEQHGYFIVRDIPEVQVKE